VPGVARTGGSRHATLAVTADRWRGDIAYADTSIRLSGTCDNAADRPVLVVPAGQPLAFTITSRDVVHSFWVPEPGIERDAYPRRRHRRRGDRGLSGRAHPAPARLQRTSRKPAAPWSKRSTRRGNAGQSSSFTAFRSS